MIRMRCDDKPENEGWYAYFEAQREIADLRAEVERVKDLARRLWRWCDSCPVISSADGDAYSADFAEAHKVLEYAADTPYELELVETEKNRRASVALSEWAKEVEAS